MPSFINTNIASLNSQNNLNRSQSALQTSLQRLSSGLRINSAKDDAAGMAIADRMTSQINGLSQASRNANDGISLAQTAEGALASLGDNLQRMRTLSVQAANGTNSASDRASLQAEISQLQQEINRTAQSTQFNGQNIIDGSLSNAQFQVGANANQTINFGIGNAQANAIGNNALTAANSTGLGAVHVGVTTNTYAVSGNSNLIANSQTLTIASSAGTYTTTASTASSNTTIGTLGGSAAQFAQLVNVGTPITGITATATTTATLATFTAGTASLTLNGAPTAAGVANPVTVSAALASATDTGGLAAAINAASGTTGITAVADTVTGKITLTQASGYDIGIINKSAVATFTMQGSTGAVSAVLGVNATATNAAVVGGTVAFSGAASYTVASSLISTGGGIFQGAAANAANGSTLSAVSAIDVTTLTNGVPTGANSAITIIDAALNSINSARAALGAVQNRFASAVSTLQTTAENITSARSRIQDTDFAAETASLTRAQILQQAGTAMLAQANQIPNGVLALLR